MEYVRLDSGEVAVVRVSRWGRPSWRWVHRRGVGDHVVMASTDCTARDVAERVDPLEVMARDRVPGKGR